MSLPKFHPLLPSDAIFGLTSGRLGPIRAQDFESWEQSEDDPLELIEGWPLPMTSGTFASGEALAQLIVALAPLVQEKGWRMSLDARHILPAPADTVVFPDIAIHATDDMGQRPGSESVTRVPEVVIELLSADTCARDRAPRGAKFLAYGMSGVLEYYYAWPDGREAAGFHWKEGTLAPVQADREGFLASPVLGGRLRLAPAALRR